EYMFWKQSISLMADSCEISGSMCFPTGVALRRDKFCLYFLQRLLALTAVKNMLYLHRESYTFIIGIFRPLIFIIPQIIIKNQSKYKSKTYHNFYLEIDMMFIFNCIYIKLR